MTAQTSNDTLKNIVAHCKEYGFIFPSSEIYEGLSAVYDYGQNGTALKNNLKKYWWDSMTLVHDNIVGIDAAIFMHPTVWKASGHVDVFNDPMIDNKDSKKRYRADMLIEDQIQKYETKLTQELEKAQKRFGTEFNPKLYLQTNPNAQNLAEKKENLQQNFIEALKTSNLERFKELIIEHKIVCPVSGTSNWTDVRQFNLMFSTEIGAMSDGASTVYLRPETAQGIFVNYLNVQKTGRMKIPFGIAQIGKAFRNEIIARQFILRMREFEQMEMQFFVTPGTELDWFNYWKQKRMQWHLNMGLPEQNYRFHDHDKLAHYANAACDIEYNFPFGFKELEGIHSRTDFDLTQHQKYSNKKISYFDAETKASYTPYVIETSIGLDRMCLALIANGYKEEANENNDPENDEQKTRTVLHFPQFLAPVKAAFLPLVKKDGLPEIAQKLFNDTKLQHACQYDEKDSVGKRYRRQDAIGTPFCITVDYNSLTENTVTIRDCKTMQQQRINIDKVNNYLNEALNYQNVLQKLC